MTEIKMTDLIGDLSPEQIDHLSRGLEHAHEMTLKRAAGGGRYWLDCIEGGGLLIRPDRTVEQVWNFAEAVSGSRREYEAGNALDSLLPPNR